MGDKAFFFKDNHLVIYHSSTGIYEKISNHPIIADNWISMAVVEDKAIFFGGRKNDKSPSSAIDIYDSKSGEWKKVTHKIEARYEGSVAVVGNKAIFFGGWKGSGIPSSTIDIYDNDKDVWKTVDQRGYTPQARGTASVAVVGNKVIFFGGRKEQNTPLSAIDIYDGNTGIWKTVKQKDYNPEARIWVSVAVVGNKAVFFGGSKNTEGDYSSAIDIYDSSTEKWETVNHQTEARAMAATAVVGNKAIFFGGWTGYKHSSDVDIYDAASGKWISFKIDEKNTPLKIMKDSFSVIVKENKAVFFAIDDNMRSRRYEVEFVN